MIDSATYADGHLQVVADDWLSMESSVISDRANGTVKSSLGGCILHTNSS